MRKQEAAWGVINSLKHPPLAEAQREGLRGGAIRCPLLLVSIASVHRPTITCRDIGRLESRPRRIKRSSE